jgi:hypothetical protein
MGVSLYSREFYDGIADGSYKAAQVLLPIVFKLLKPQSIIDIGAALARG